MTIAATATIERTIDAPIDRVFAAFTDPGLIVQWFSPNPDHELSFVGDVAGDDELLTHHASCTGRALTELGSTRTNSAASDGLLEERGLEAVSLDDSAGNQGGG